MVSAQLTSGSTADDRDLLFFRDVVRSYTDDPRHLTRSWLGDLVREKLQQPDTRYVVVTGAPGSGKSSLIAQLASDDPRSLIYLLRRDQRTSLAEGSAKSFLVRVGLQFASLHPDAFETDALQVEITQSSTTTSADSEVTGARIGRMLASPFYQTVVRVRQQVGSLGGRLTGLEIDELVSDPRLLSVSDLEALAMRTPAGILSRTQPAGRLIVLVDALDELARHGATGKDGRFLPGQDLDIMTWLRDQPPLPENIRFVLTSRPGEALEAFLEKQAPFVACITLDPTDERVRDDVGNYTQMLAAQMRAAHSFSDDAIEKRFVDQARVKAVGNLGYMGALGRAFDHALSGPDRRGALNSLLDLAELPPTLEELYAFFFHQIKAQLAGQVVEIEDQQSLSTGFAPAWPAVYQKVIAVLSVTHEPLTTDQVADLGQIAADRSYVLNAIDDLEQFLQGSGARHTVRFYHPTVAEFLTDTTTRDDPIHTDLFVDLVRWNARIAALLDARFASTPDALDDYAIRYRITHQIAGGGPQSAHEAMTSMWMLFKRARTGDDRSFHADLMQVAQSLRESSTPDLVALVRCYLVDAMLLARLSVLPSPVAAIWAICGQGIRAESLLSLTSNPGKRAEAYVMLAEGLAVIGATERARDALRSAVDAARMNPYYGDRLATLRAVLSSPVVDPVLASLVLDVISRTETEAPELAEHTLSWLHESVATLYERASKLLPPETVAELRARLEEMLQQPGDDGSYRTSILLSAAIASEVLGESSAVASYAELALAEADRPPALAGIKSLCTTAHTLRKLTDKRWTAKALGRALARLREGLEGGEAYATVLIAKTGLDTLPGFDVSGLDIGRAFDLARVTPDPAVFRLLAEIYSALGDTERATQAADLCYETVRMTGGNQEDFTSLVSTDVIWAFQACRHRAGLLRLLDDAATFMSPGWEWERDHVVGIVSDAAVDLRFDDVLERAFVVADDTRNIWERASALSRVGKAYAMARDEPRAGSVLKEVEATVAEGLRLQFPRKRVRGALLLAAALADSTQVVDTAADEDSWDPRYLAVANAVMRGPADGGSDDSRSLTEIFEGLVQWVVEEFSFYTLLKLVAAENDLDAVDAIERWDAQTGDALKRSMVRDLRVLAMSRDPQELVTTARSVFESFERLDVKPGAALAVIDALMTAGLANEAYGMVQSLRSSAQRPRHRAVDEVAWEAAAYLATQRLNGVAGSQEALTALLDHARGVDMVRTALTLADTAPAIAVLVGTQSVGNLLSVVDEAVALE